MDDALGVHPSVDRRAAAVVRERADRQEAEARDAHQTGGEEAGRPD
jgi:hypothetical protein